MLQIKFRPGEKETWKSRPRKEKKPQTKENPPKASRKPKEKKRKRRSKPKFSRTVSFSDTAVGRFLYVYAPLEYHLLMMYKEIHLHIDSNLIERVAMRSDNEAFRTIRFRKALISYRRFGCHQRIPVEWNLRDAVYFAKNSFHIYETIRQCTE